MTCFGDGGDPSPCGRGRREAAGEGSHAVVFRQSCPHPALRATFSRREKDWLHAALCVIALTVTAFAASAFDGQWTGELSNQTVQLSLKSQGVKVTGTLAVGTEPETPIQEGIIEGNTLSIVKFKTKTGETLMLWTGTLKWGNTKTSDEIAFVREAGPQGGRIEFTVKRVP
jgi:hypothetical protein